MRASCVGAILFGRDEGERPQRLGLLDASLARNAYGRQVHSTTRRVHLDVLGRSLDCVFIRAPRITAVGRGVEVLGHDGGEPLLVRAPGLLAATFHPELSGDGALHRAFPERDPWARWMGAPAGGPGTGAAGEPPAGVRSPAGSR